MRFRNLRIAFSTTCLLACLLLIALWVRSYWKRTSVEILVTPANRYYLHSTSGTVVIEREARVFDGIEFLPVYGRSDYSPLATNAGLKIISDSNGDVHATSISYWLLLTTNLVLSAAPWIKWSTRFSIRTMIIATTLVALGLGVIVWAAKS